MADAEELKSVRDLIQSFLKAKKNLRIYPPNNPIYSKTVEDNFARLQDVFELIGSLSLQFTRNEIFFDGDSVFKGAGKEDNLALFFSRDGVREVTFENTVTVEEYQAFLEILAFDFDREDVADDVVTLMWEKDFENIKYVVDESVLLEEDEEEYENEAVSQAKDRSATDDDLAKAYAYALKSEEQTREVTLVPVSQKDVRMVEELIKRSGYDKKRRLINILFDMLMQATNFFEFHEITSIIESTLDYSLRENDIQAAIEILKRAKVCSASKKIRSEIAKELHHICMFAGSEEIVKRLGEMLDTEPGIEPGVFQEYIIFLTKESVPHFIKILGELKTIGARKNVVNTLIFLGKKDISVFAKSLRDPRWYVVRNIIYVLRKIGNPRAVDFIVSAVGHSDPRVRKEVLLTLGDLGGERATVTVRACLDDPEPFVRTTAAKALGSIGSDFAKYSLLERLTDKRFLFAEFNEKKECYEVLASWKDDAVFDFLMKALKKRAIFKRAKYNELKAAAAHALGIFGDRSALPALEKLRRSNKRLLSEHAYGAIKRIEYGKR